MSAFISMLESWAGNLIIIGLSIFCLRTVVLWVFFPDRDWKCVLSPNRATQNHSKRPVIII